MRRRCNSARRNSAPCLERALVPIARGGQVRFLNDVSPVVTPTCHSPAELSTLSFQPAMLESPLSRNIARNYLPIADQLVFISSQPFKTDRSPCVQFARADSQLCSEAITKSIGEARGH